MKRNNAPFVMHLEQVCRLIDMGQHFVVEFNPCSDVNVENNHMIRNVGLGIKDGGRISMIMPGGIYIMAYDMTLANYRKLWRCWQNGVPNEAQRRGLKWR